MTHTTNDHTPGPWQVLPVGNTRRFQVRGPNDAGPTAYAVAADMREANARLIAAAPDMLATLIQAVSESGFSLSGPTDTRAAEHGEPAWVCNARAVIAEATVRP